MAAVFCIGRSVRTSLHTSPAVTPRRMLKKFQLFLINRHINSFPIMNDMLEAKNERLAGKFNFVQIKPKITGHDGQLFGYLHFLSLFCTILHYPSICEYQNIFSLWRGLDADQMTPGRLLVFFTNLWYNGSNYIAMWKVVGIKIKSIRAIGS